MASVGDLSGIYLKWSTEINPHLANPSLFQNLIGSEINNLFRLLWELMQLAGLFILPAAIVLQLIFDDPDNNQSELERTGQDVFGFGVDGLLVAMIFGVCVFYAGRVLEGYASQQ